MNQRTLFGDDGQLGTYGGTHAKHLARSNDPQTSKDAAKGFDKARTQAALLEGFRIYGGKAATAKEAAAAGMESRMDIESVRKRVNDLISQRLVENTGERRTCVITGKGAGVYKITKEGRRR